MNKKAMLRMLFFLLVPLAFCGCMESMVKPEAKIDTGEEMGLPPLQWPPSTGSRSGFRMEGR